MSRTNRKNRRDPRERVMRAPLGIKRLGEQDLEDKRRKVLAFLRENKGTVVTVGTVTGYGFAFRFNEVWEHMFPGQRCPSRK